MKPISADSHVVEGRDVFTGLADRFGDQAPRIMDVGDQVDAIVVPANGMRGVSVARMGMAATRLARNEPLSRKPGHKPDVAHMKDPELVALFNKGYEGMRKGLVDGAHRYEDQDVDGLAAEFLYPGFFGMFGLRNTPLLVALQKNYNDAGVHRGRQPDVGLGLPAHRLDLALFERGARRVVRGGPRRGSHEDHPRQRPRRCTGFDDQEMLKPVHRCSSGR